MKLILIGSLPPKERTQLRIKWVEISKNLSEAEQTVLRAKIAKERSYNLRSYSAITSWTKPALAKKLKPELTKTYPRILTNEKRSPKLKSKPCCVKTHKSIPLQTKTESSVTEAAKPTPTKEKPVKLTPTIKPEAKEKPTMSEETPQKEKPKPVTEAAKSVTTSAPSVKPEAKEKTEKNKKPKEIKYSKLLKIVNSDKYALNLIWTQQNQKYNSIIDQIKEDKNESFDRIFKIKTTQGYVKAMIPKKLRIFQSIHTVKCPIILMANNIQSEAKIEIVKVMKKEELQ
jgi:cell division septation protein DedD